MERHNNTYGDLINNKFCELLSVNSTKTWLAMKELLDRKLPEKKKRKWLFWFTTKTGIIAIVLFSLFASAAGTYINYKQQNEKNANLVDKEPKKEVIQKKNDLISEEYIDKNNNHGEINIQPEIKTKTSVALPVKIKERGIMQEMKVHMGKKVNPSATLTLLTPAVQTIDTITHNLIIIPVTTKDSMNRSLTTPPAETAERKRAF